MDRIAAIYMWLVNNGYPTSPDTLELAKTMAEEENEENEGTEDELPEDDDFGGF